MKNGTQHNKENVISHSEDWERKANNLARAFCPSIYPCKKCNNPVVEGYTCHFCGDDNPNVVILVLKDKK